MTVAKILTIQQLGELERQGLIGCRHSMGDAIETARAAYNALCFAASVIRSGEPWTETCEQKIGALLDLMREH